MREFLGRTPRDLLAAKIRWEMDQAERRLQQEMWDALLAPPMKIGTRVLVQGPRIEANYSYRPGWPPAWVAWPPPVTPINGLLDCDNPPEREWHGFSRLTHGD